jgi:hypothetical protein
MPDSMRDITNIQEAFVADHIAELRREGSALRAERERDHLREHAVEGTTAADHPFDLPSRRVRLGRWLVAFGEAIAGPSRSTRPVGATSRAVAQPERSDDPCGDTHDRLAPAA